jgi:hypothetical protein
LLLTPPLATEPPEAVVVVPPVLPPAAEVPPLEIAPPLAVPVEVVPPELTVPPAPAAPLLPPLATLPPLPLLPPDPVAPPVPATPPLPDAPPALGSVGGVPGFPVALSLVRDRTAMPFTKLTFLVLWVDRLNGDAQSPAAQPDGTPEAWNSSRHSCLKLPLSYEEYCIQLMYWCTGKVVLLMLPPKLELPGQMLKWMDMPAVAFWA